MSRAKAEGEKERTCCMEKPNSEPKEEALDGLFLMTAEEERGIPQDPVARTTDLLKKVFGSR